MVRGHPQATWDKAGPQSPHPKEPFLLSKTLYKSLRMLCQGAQTWVQSLREARSTCLPPTGQHKNSPPGRSNVFLELGICISLPIQGNTTTNHPMPQQYARHMSFLSGLIPVEEGSHPRAKEPTKDPPRRAGITMHHPAAASETSGSSVTTPGLGQAQHIQVPTRGIPAVTLRDTTHPRGPSSGATHPKYWKRLQLRNTARKSKRSLHRTTEARNGPECNPSHLQTYLLHWAASFLTASLLPTLTTEVGVNRHLFKMQPC